VGSACEARPCPPASDRKLPDRSGAHRPGVAARDRSAAREGGSAAGRPALLQRRRPPEPRPENPPAHGPAINGNIAAHDCPPWERLPRLEEALAAQLPKPRHRPPDPIPRATIKDLLWELAQREARRGDPELTQEKIAGRLGLERTRVQQAEALKRVGWDLLRSHPEFSANDDVVRWPSARDAARILASGALRTDAPLT
jgi:hypothetical protein